MISIHELGDSFNNRIPERYSGYKKIFERLLISLLSDGNILFNENSDHLLSNIVTTFTDILGLNYGRIDSNSDLMASDLCGLSVFQQESDEFRIYPGAFSNNIVIINQINLASPYTQSSIVALIDEPETLRLKKITPQLIIATDSNDFDGRFSMPIVLKERFFSCITLKPLDRIDKIQYLKNENIDIQKLSDISIDLLQSYQSEIKSKKLSDELIELILMITSATRNDKRLSVGASANRSKALHRIVVTYALLNNREAVFKDIMEFAVEVILPSIVISADSILNRSKPEDIVKSIADSTLIKWKEKYGVL